MAVMYTACSSGMCGGSLLPNTVFWSNNLWVFDGVTQLAPDKNFVQTTNVITKTDPGFVNLKGTTAADYDLTAAATTLIDKGTALADITLDFLNRPVPDSSGKPDIGAFEYNSGAATSTPPTYPGAIGPSHGNLIGQGGAPGSGGSIGAGGSTTKPAGTGGSTSKPAGTGGATTVPAGTGGVASGSGGRTGSGGASAAGGTTSASSPPAAGGSTVSSNGGSASGGSPGAGGNTIPTQGKSQSGCSCRLDQQGGGPGLWSAMMVGFALLAVRRRSRRR